MTVYKYSAQVRSTQKPAPLDAQVVTSVVRVILLSVTFIHLVSCYVYVVVGLAGKERTDVSARVLPSGFVRELNINLGIIPVLLIVIIRLKREQNYIGFSELGNFHIGIRNLRLIVFIG